MLDSLGQVLHHATREFGDRTALVIGEKSFSFRELDQLSDALAASLVRLGVRSGARVTLYDRHCAAALRGAHRGCVGRRKHHAARRGWGSS